MAAPIGSSASKLAVKVVQQTGLKEIIGAIIFLHGSGDSGEHFHSWIVDTLGEELSFPHLRVLYPTAPSRPYSAAGGMYSNVWFNRYTIEFESPEDTSSVQHMNAEISKLIQDQVDKGVRKERIIIGGFSMGGSMALHVAYSQHTSLAGVFTLSSFLNQESLVYKELQANKGLIPPLFACHGNADEMVLYDWGKSTVETLQEHNVPSEFHTVPGLNHELHKGVLQQLKAWILKVLPEA